jgi:hypothetical protein
MGRGIRHEEQDLRSPRLIGCQVAAAVVRAVLSSALLIPLAASAQLHA